MLWFHEVHLTTLIFLLVSEKKKKSKSYFAENKLLPANNRTLHASLGIAMARVHQRLCNSHKKKPKANSFVTLKKKKHNCS